MSEPALDVIDKWSGFAKVFSQKSFEVWPRDGVTILVAILVLGLLIVDGSIEERDYKQDTVRAGSPYSVKIVFALLTEVIAVHMQFSII